MNKAISIISSLYRSMKIGKGKKGKPESITYYNNTKYGVDTLEQMCRLYSTKSGTRRWSIYWTLPPLIPGLFTKKLKELAFLIDRFYKI